MMRALAPRSSSLAVAFALALGAAGPASADVFDLTFSRFVVGPKDQVPPAPSGTFADPQDAYNISHGVLAAYRQVVSEMSVALAPKILTTADTIGYSGFQFDIDYSFTNISNKTCGDPNPATAQKDQCPWQYGVEGHTDAAGNHTDTPGMIHTVSVMARKGIWLPLPSFEIGAGATKVMQSSIYAVQVYGKLSLHEGFHGWPIPSLSIRGSGLRVLGESQLDLTMAQIDAMLSKSFGIAGTVTLVPYLGAAWLYIIPRGQVLDLTPACDALSGRGCASNMPGGTNSLDLNNNAVFSTDANQNITRWRFFGGMRLNYNVLVLTTDLIVTPCGDFNGGCSDNRHGNAKVPDNSITQYTFSVSGGFLF